MGFIGEPWYRFEPNNSQRLKSLKSNKLWISNPNNFNDPFDFDLSVGDLSRRSGFEERDLKNAALQVFEGFDVNSGHWLYSEEIVNAILHWARGIELDFDYVAQLVRDHIKTFGVQCFSKHWNIPLSWAHYSSQHQGFCIEYDVHQMNLVSANGDDFAVYDINYTNSLPEICLTEVIFSPHQVLKRLLSTKTVDWSYEQESRIIHFRNQGEAIEMPNGIKMVSLIAGLKMPEELIVELRDVAAVLDIPAYKVERSKYSQTLSKVAL